MPPKRPKVAAVFTEFTYRSHAHVILENFLEPYLFNGKRTEPGVEVVTFFADQTPKGHMTADVAREYKIPIFRTIDEALCLGGKARAVDAVLSIDEQGQYPRNKLGQHEYPRKRIFDDIVAVMTANPPLGTSPRFPDSQPRAVPKRGSIGSRRAFGYSTQQATCATRRVGPGAEGVGRVPDSVAEVQDRQVTRQIATHSTPQCPRVFAPATSG